MYKIGDKFSSEDILRYMEYRDIRHNLFPLRAWRETVSETRPTATVRLPPGYYVFDAISGIPFATTEVEEMGGRRRDEKRYDIFYADRLRWKRWNRKKTALLAKRGWNARVIYETE